MSQQSNIKYTVAAGLWTVLVLVLLLLPKRDLDPVSTMVIPHMDKVVHFVLFAILSFLSEKALVERGWLIHTIALLLILVSFAGLTEWLQQFAEGRSMELMDFVVDVLGIVVALLIVKYWK